MGNFEGNISIVDEPFRVCNDHGQCNYDVENINGHQVCFIGVLWNDDCDNWCESSYIDAKCSYLSNYFPINLFMGKREGDVVEITIKNKKCYLKCCQNGYLEENFEDALYRLSQSFAGIFPAATFDPDFSESMQQLMIIEYHEKYAKSLGLKERDPSKFRYNTQNSK